MLGATKQHGVPDMTTITLQQFEQINELFMACLNRPALEQIAAHPLASENYMRTVYFCPEWELMDACIEVVGYDAANAFPCAVDCAASILTDALTCKIDIVDMEAA